MKLLKPLFILFLLFVYSILAQGAEACGPFFERLVTPAPLVGDVKIAVLHNHKLLGGSLASTLAKSEAKASYGGEVTLENIKKALAEGDNVLVVDAGRAAPIAKELAQAIAEADSSPKLILLGDTLDDKLVEVFAQSRAHAVVSQEDADLESVLQTINGVTHFEYSVSKDLMERLQSQYAKEADKSSERAAAGSTRPLTEREVEVLTLISQDYTNNDIANALNMSIYTVKNHVHRILNKLNVESRAAAAIMAVEHGWIPPSGLKPEK